MQEQVTILHTNDIHSHFENWPKIRRFLQQQKQQLIQQGQTVLIFDVGDAVDWVHPLSEATDGKANVEMLNTIEYDGVTIGNNEGIGNSHQQLDNLYTNANFSVILSNFSDQTTNLIPKWCQEYRVIITKQQTKIGIIAATAPFGPTYAMNSWHAWQIDEFMPTLLARLTDKVDVIILLSHLGIDADRKIAQAYPQIDVILGSHTHHLLEHGEICGQTLICAAGKWGQYVGKVTLQLEKNKIVTKKATVQATADLPSAAGDQVEINNYQKQGELLLTKQKIAQLPKPYPVALNSDSPLMQAQLKALEEVFEVDTAILNSGLFLDGLKAGIVTKNDLHKILPHSMRAIKVRLNGYNLWRLIREMERNRSRLRRSVVKGNGFRGKIFGELVYDNIVYLEKEKQVLWHGKPLDLGKDYELAMVDNFIYGPYFPTLEIAGHFTYLGDRFLRDILGDYFAARFGV